MSELEERPSETIEAISGRIRRISNLTPVSMTLTRLCLCDQQIEGIDNLNLPNLLELLLHQNRIQKIEGLEG